MRRDPDDALADLHAWLTRSSSAVEPGTPPIWAGRRRSRPRQAVIFTLGLKTYDDSICPIVLAHLPVRIVAILATPEVMAKWYDSYRLGLEEQHLVVEPEIWENEDFADIAAKTAALIDKLFDKYQLTPADVVLDVTHGTALMSLSAFFVAERKEVECQYIASDYDPNEKIIPATARPILVVSHSSAMTSTALPDPLTP